MVHQGSKKGQIRFQKEDEVFSHGLPGRKVECDSVIASDIGDPDDWEWSTDDKSHEVKFCGQDHTEIILHPDWSSGTAGIRGKKALDCCRYYWELQLSQRIFGTSIMFGIATKSAKLHTNSFMNLLGEDDQGWGLSHKGLLWHDGRWARYTGPFSENKATTVGLLYDGVAGTLTYYKDGSNLGVAFRNLHLGKSKLYPFACSTAAKSRMKLMNCRRSFVSLQERCRHIIARRVGSKTSVAQLQLPAKLINYVQQAIPKTERIFAPAAMCTVLDM